MLYIATELDAWCLNRCLRLNMKKYDLIMKAIFQYAALEGFQHKCRYKKRSLQRYGKKQLSEICVICREPKRGD